jgi:transposase-like protein
MNRTLPTEDVVRQTLHTMLNQAAATGTRPTVQGLARQLGIPNATFWRRYRDIAIELRQASTTSSTPTTDRPPARVAELEAKVAALRRERDELADQLRDALGHLQHLAVDNARLRRGLEAAHDVTRLDSRTPRPQPR